MVENVMHSQLLEYFRVNTLLSAQQYGFIPHRSTELATLELMDRNINAMNNQLTPINIYLDLSKAFDSLDHNVLRSKLKYYGVQGESLDYLICRSQYVDLDHRNSDINEVHCGIPHGYVMGPLLFNIFLNDIVEFFIRFDHVCRRHYTDINT